MNMPANSPQISPLNKYLVVGVHKFDALEYSITIHSSLISVGKIHNCKLRQIIFEIDNVG